MRAEKYELITKSRESMLVAVQTFNNPLSTFRTETFIVLSSIAWTYLLYAYYKTKGVDFRYFNILDTRKRYIKNDDGSYRHWELSKCISADECPLDSSTKNNIKFLVGLRNYIVHQKPTTLDSYMSARYQACALNFNYYIKKLFGKKYGLDNMLALSLQFAELDYEQAQIIKDKANIIPVGVQTYIADFDSGLTDDERNDEKFAYRLLFTKALAKREGQADRVVQFIDASSPQAKTIEKEYWVKEEKEKPKFLAKQVVKKIQALGYKDFTITKHTNMWRKHDAKNPSKGYGVIVVKTWHWYQTWIDFLINELKKY